MGIGESKYRAADVVYKEERFWEKMNKSYTNIFFREACIDLKRYLLYKVKRLDYKVTCEA